MGGSSFVIPVIPDEKLLSPDKQASFLKRLFGKKRNDNVNEQEKPQKHLPLVDEIPSKKLAKPLFNDLQGYIKQEITEPWEATKSFFNSYFTQSYYNLYVRSYRFKGETKTSWYVQLAYSGCAGMGDISARLASHWTELWFNAHKERIFNDYLIPFGLTLDPEGKFIEEVDSFVPINEFGYALYSQEEYYDEELEMTCYFSVDGWVFEHCGSENYATLLKKIESCVAEIMADGKCRCQMCMPGFNIDLVSKIK